MKIDVNQSEDDCRGEPIAALPYKLVSRTIAYQVPRKMVWPPFICNAATWSELILRWKKLPKKAEAGNVFF